MPAEPPTPSANLPARRRRFPLVAWSLAVAVVVFGWGIVHLFELRFQTGDVYPAYSVLRNDPLGAAAFYDALDSLPGLHVERNLRPLERLGNGPVTFFGRPQPATDHAADAGPLTCFYLGADPSEWPVELTKPDASHLEEILRAGGRVVMTFLPGDTLLTTDRLEHNRHADDPSPSPSPGPNKKLSPREKRRQEEMRPADLVERWGIDFRRIEPRKKPVPAGKTPPRNVFPFPTPPPPGETPAPVSLVKGAAAGPVPGSPFEDAGLVPWHTALDFRVDTPEAKAAGWHALYLREGRPVIVARSFGTKGGELILASDSYFLSNEALRADPRPALLADLVGNGRRIIFDERHHGVQENPGLMTLARRYGLQGGLAAAGLLVGLFIWRNVLSLVPPPPPTAEALAAATTVTGRDTAAGFLNLLRRGVPRRELLKTCVAQWQAGAGRRPPDAAAVERLRALADEEAARPTGGKALAAAYRAMCAAVKPGR